MIPKWVIRDEAFEAVADFDFENVNNLKQGNIRLDSCLCVKEVLVFENIRMEIESREKSEKNQNG